MLERFPIRLMVFIKHNFQNTRIWAGLLIAIFLITGILTLQNYGLTWDEGLGNLFFGERYLHYFTSFNPKYLDFKADLDSLSQYPLRLYLSPFHDSPNKFPPVADTLSAMTMYIFSYGLKWLNPIDGFHLFTVILSAVFLWTLYRFAEARIGKFAALMAILFLGTFPRFWADMHFNVKDVPETIFFGWVLMAYWRWFEKQTWKRALGTGVLMGCALGIKANAIFIIPILLISIFPWSLRREEIRSGFLHFTSMLGQYFVMAISSISVYILSWPYLYTDTLSRLKGYWSYILIRGGQGEANHWNIDPLRQVLTTMPELMLLVGIIGIVFVLRQAWKDNSPIWRLLLAWAFIPILRASIPGAVNFDGIRHFLEFVPAFALIAGYGASKIVSLLARDRPMANLAVQASVVLLMMINLVQINLTFYPYLHIYYNEFVGGLAGARDKFLGTEATDYWASSYRQGMDWINENAPVNSSINALIAPWIVDISGPVLVRADIKVISQLPDFTVMSESKDPYYLMFIMRDWPSRQDEIGYTVKNAKPVDQIVVDRVPILEIYQFGGN